MYAGVPGAETTLFSLRYNACFPSSVYPKKRSSSLANGKKGIRLEGYTPLVIDLENGNWSADDCLVYNESSRALAGIIGRMFWQADMPRPFGVFYCEDRPSYEKQLHNQISVITKKRGKGDLQKLLEAGDTWMVE